jgi:hypothetical protein
MFETNDINLHESPSEKRLRIKNNIGVVLCTVQKNGRYSSPENQIDLAGEINAPAIQFDFRDRTLEEIKGFASMLLDYRHLNPYSSISIHGDTPDFNDTDLTIKNYERIREELRFLQDIVGESYTVHPPLITSLVFKHLPPEIQNGLIENYAHVFIEAIEEAVAHDNKLCISIENMAHGGPEDLFGQTIDELLLLIKKVREDLPRHGISEEIAKNYIGITLDVNNALNDVEAIDYRLILRRWFRGLGDNIKIVYVNTPSNVTAVFMDKYNLAIELAARYSPNARIMLKSKQDNETTKRIYRASKDITEDDTQ